MEISGTYRFEVPQVKVWDVLQDPRALSMIIPMAMNVKQVAANQYTGELFFRVGDVAGKFQGKIELLNVEPPDSYDIEVQGTSPVGHVHIKGKMHLESGIEETTMHYSGNISFGGRIASVGSRLLEVSVNSIVQQSFKTLNNYLKVKRASQTLPKVTPES